MGRAVGMRRVVELMVEVMVEVMAEVMAAVMVEVRHRLTPPPRRG